MTTLTTPLPDGKIRDAGMRSLLDAFLSRVGQGFNAYMETRGRAEEINRLNALSDAGLARLGIKREDIPQYVFRDLFYV